MRVVNCYVVLVGLALLGAGHARSDDDFKIEPGFSSIFNGRDLSGWQTKQGESLAGKTESPDKRFKALDGALIIDATVKGDVLIQTAQEFSGDTHLKFEFLPGAGCNNDLFFRG